MSMIRNESVLFKVKRNGAEFAEIFPVSAPSLMADSSSQIKMSLRGKFLEVGRDVDGKPVEVDWLNDEIKPVLKINGAEYPLGILLPASATFEDGNDGKTVSIEAYDRSWRIRDTKRGTPVYFQAETLYLDAVEALVVESGIEMVARTDTDLALTEDREDWNAGTSNLEIVNQLLSEINYNEVWFDSYGAAVLEPKSDASAVNIQHVFTDKKPDPRNPKEVGIVSIFSGISKTADIYNAPNVYICICSNPDKESGMTAIAENVLPMSPLSIVRRGRRIVAVEYVDNVASLEELQAYAERKVSESILTGEQITVTTPLLPSFVRPSFSRICYPLMRLYLMPSSKVGFALCRVGSRQGGRCSQFLAYLA